INRQWYVGQLGYYRQVDQLLDYVRARWLRTGSGRWLSLDPKDSPRYGYAYGEASPAALSDPRGLDCKPTHIKAKLDTTNCNCLSWWDPSQNNCCMCHWDFKADWNLTWRVNPRRGGNPSDCWVEQYWYPLDSSCRPDRYGYWHDDNGRGWPYCFANFMR